MILLIDNYDSFVHNLARYLRRLGQETRVVRNDQVTVSEVSASCPSAIVLSPGPCAPRQAGCCLDVVRELHQVYPILGVCLGHQVIAEAFGGEIVRAGEPVHGRASMMQHSSRGVFDGIGNPLRVGRYHSLIVRSSSLPACLRVDATLDDETIMAVSHRAFPVVGWQFHPESVLTEQGIQLLENFMKAVGCSVSNNVAAARGEVAVSVPRRPDWFERAIDFPGK